MTTRKQYPVSKIREETLSAIVNSTNMYSFSFLTDNCASNLNPITLSQNLPVIDFDLANFKFII